MGMVVVSFALTSLNSTIRLLRFNIEEMGTDLRIPGSRNRYAASALACGAIGFFAFYNLGGKPAALALWQLFGTTNQLLAGLTLLLVVGSILFVFAVWLCVEALIIFAKPKRVTHPEIDI